MIRLDLTIPLIGPTTPTVNCWFGLLSRFARRYYGNLDLISFPLLTKMFQFSRYCFHNLWIQLWMMGY